MPYLLALDQGTTSSRAIVFDHAGQQVAVAQREIAAHFPQPGWVEQDSHEIWSSQLAVAQAVIQSAGLAASDIAAIGIANQRETTIVWNRLSGQPVAPAIVWQDRRTADHCEVLKARGVEGAVRAKTGLVLDPYFSGTKLQWILEHVANARHMAEKGELAFGTVDCWLLWQLTDGQVHATDVTNASRTLLFNIHTQQWDQELLTLFNIPRSVLPTVHPSSFIYGKTTRDLLGGEITIGALVGDQQAALFGQGCYDVGMSKNTYGTGCFMLMQTGAHAQLSTHGLLTTAAARTHQQKQYALEGSVFVGGAVVQWLRDQLGIIQQAAEVEALALTVSDSGGVLFVPAFTGLGAPYWQTAARGGLFGLTRGTSKAHIARAALEAIAYQSAELLTAMQQDAGCDVTQLRVDGGACANNLLMQIQADVLGVEVIRPKILETTALGAIYLAGLTVNVWQDTEAVSRYWQVDTVFKPNISRDQAEQMMIKWRGAITRITH